LRHHKQQDRIAATMYSLGTWFDSGICVDTLHKGENDDDDDDNNNNNNNNRGQNMSHLL
jgi:hypothetical protein